MHKIFIGQLFLTLLVMSACGGGSDSVVSSSSTSQGSTVILTGVVVDSPVSNLSYKTATQSGTTNANGEFSYVEGETVTFSIGALNFPSVMATDAVTPLQMAGSISPYNEVATNIAILLQSLDDNGNPADGIHIPATAVSVAAAINFNVPTATFQNNAVVTNMVANSGSTNTTLVTPAQAQAHLASSLAALNPVQGVWKILLGGGKFQYLVLFTDHTFFYGENDGVVPDGFEAGTYAYDSTAGNITFHLTYDDNGPGQDSGIGNIGTPVVASATLNPTANTLSLLNGALVFNADPLLNGTAPVVGLWRSASAFQEYLVLFADGTFMYAENGPNPQPENGMEAGTYTYNATTSEITFNLTYDDNAPGANSGVGDIGTPVVVPVVLSNGGNAMKLAGVISLTKGI